MTRTCTGESAGSKTLLPFLLLVFASILIFVFYFSTGALELQLKEDSPGYINLAKNFNMTAIVSGTRTFGYPLLLKCVMIFSKDLGILPIVQFIIHAGAVFLFYFSLRCFYFDRWVAFFSAIPLLTLTIFREHVALAVTDLPATSFNITTVSLLLITMKKPQKRELICRTMSKRVLEI